MGWLLSSGLGNGGNYLGNGDLTSEVGGLKSEWGSWDIGSSSDVCVRF